MYATYGCLIMRKLIEDKTDEVASPSTPSIHRRALLKCTAGSWRTAGRLVGCLLYNRNINSEGRLRIETGLPGPEMEMNVRVPRRYLASLTSCSWYASINSVHGR
ncbi:hypothetical protein BS47DRAFT_1127942 [Hydnum rufescens UP504]|uniref:Uncharacterized protein n=1 Tax=Hydnum rufescens UP504 TaxID=1448309 RepID=A0A9P6DRA1_9AGAM|nr:hypothetical protein BS47DRAFT_1127942 [Hydnum rufescens UP504]